MTLDLMTYRVRRLRWLIAVAMLPPALMLVWLWSRFGAPETWVFALIAGLPLIHAVVYPNAWMETLSVSGTAVSMLLLGSLIDTGLPIDHRVFRLVMLFVFGFFVFLAFVWVTPAVMFAGPNWNFTIRAAARSKLDPAALKAAVTFYPGRDDTVVTCGEPDERGVFPVTLHGQLMDLLEGTEPELGTNVVATVTEDGETATDCDLYCKIEQSDEAVHELISFAEGSETPTVTRYDFRADRNGTVVRYAETGTPLTPFLRLGLFLQDYLADYLEYQIEIAENRTPRSNRSFAVRQFAVDLARLFPDPDDGTPRIG